MYDNLYLHGFEDSEAVSGWASDTCAPCFLCCVVAGRSLHEHPRNALRLQWAERALFSGESGEVGGRVCMKCACVCVCLPGCVCVCVFERAGVWGLLQPTVQFSRRMMALLLSGLSVCRSKQRFSPTSPYGRLAGVHAGKRLHLCCSHLFVGLPHHIPPHITEVYRKDRTALATWITLMRCCIQLRRLPHKTRMHAWQINVGFPFQT